MYIYHVNMRGGDREKVPSFVVIILLDFRTIFVYVTLEIGQTRCGGMYRVWGITYSALQ